MCCGAPGTESAEVVPSPVSEETARSERQASCEAVLAQVDSFPGVTDSERTLEYWLSRLEEPDRVLLSRTEIQDHNRALRAPLNGDSHAQMNLAVLPTDVELLSQVQERLSYMHDRVGDGRYRSANGDVLEAPVVQVFTPPDVLPGGEARLHVALEALSLRCGPVLEGLYTHPVDLRFDRNACSRIPAQEPVQVLREWPNGLLWVRTRFATGWLAPTARLSPRLSQQEADRVLSLPRARFTSAAAADRVGVRPHELTAYDSESAYMLAYGEEGLREHGPLNAEEIQSTARDLSRSALLTEAFGFLGSPYGWGGHEGGRDCSRLLMDVFDRFGIGLPRHSGSQANAGTFSIDLPPETTLVERGHLLDSAHREGIALLYFPGHIMLYLGRGEAGDARVLHSLGEYYTPCPGGLEGETRRDVHRVVVSGLELGEGSTRGSLLERITKIVVLGGRPGLGLQGVSSLRRAASTRIPEGVECSDSQEAAIFRSPRRPNSQSPLKVIVTAEHDPGPVELALFTPSGDRITPPMRAIGAPPWSYWTRVDEPEAGVWTAVLGDGDRVVACETFRVAPRRRRGRGVLLDRPWRPVWRWERDTENLYAAFVEQLFRAPEDEDITWPNLQVLIDDPERNLLYEHLGRGDDRDLRLHPDCADLPYFLRAYFAWKLQLPFAYRRCNRGRAGRAPTCGSINHAAEEFEPEEVSPPSDAEDGEGPTLEVPRRDEFTRGAGFLRAVASGVHSGSARTAPQDNDTDLYPVAMTRESLRPGAVYADPYGHLLVIARWQPQGIGEDYGVLIGADAQPDATVGRRRFWRGSFLFSTDTSSAGAGFKAWRPLVYRGTGRPMQVLANEELSAERTPYPWSDEQYAGSVDDFYSRMEELINPRALDAAARLITLVDALYESVQRRVQSIMA